MELVQNFGAGKILKIGEIKETNFKISATGHAFKILSSALYSDKISAIIRELSCNAYDSHVAAGHPEKPFCVTLPTCIKNEFKIRDYGTGLSQKEIETIYTTYFESTKSSSNDYIGCLGLGSKTPFSYVEQFNVISYFNGIKQIYNAFISESGTPTIALLGEDTTQEENGLEISFLVQEKDFNTFQQKARNIYKWFKTKPIINNLLDGAIKDVKYKIKNLIWGIIDHDDLGYGYNKGTWIKMGNVVYPVAKAFLPKNFEYFNLIEKDEIILFVDIGDVSIAPSREALQYDEQTVKIISARLKVLQQQVADIANDTLSSEKCYFAACAKVYSNTWNNSGIFRAALENKLIQYNNRPITPSFPHQNDLFNNLGTCDNNVFYSINKYGISNDVAWNFYSNGTEIPIILDNSLGLGKQKVKELIIFNKIKNGFVVHKKINPINKIKFLEYIGVSEHEIIDIKDLIQPINKTFKTTNNKQISRKKSDIAYVLSYDKSGNLSSKHFWSHSEKINFENEDLNYFLTIKNFNIESSNSIITDTNKALKLLNAIKVINPEFKVYGLTSTQFEKIKKNPKWINFELASPHLIKSIIDSDFNQKTADFIYAKYLSKLNFFNNSILNISNNKLTSEINNIVQDQESDTFFNKIRKICKVSFPKDAALKSGLFSEDLINQWEEYKESLEKLNQSLLDVDLCKERIIDYISKNRLTQPNHVLSLLINEMSQTSNIAYVLFGFDGMEKRDLLISNMLKNDLAQFV